MNYLVNIFVDRCMREMKAKVGKVGARLKLNGVDWSIAACLFVDDTVLLAESEGKLQRVVDQLAGLVFPGKSGIQCGRPPLP